jgi:hypothetical protein
VTFPRRRGLGSLHLLVVLLALAVWFSTPARAASGGAAVAPYPATGGGQDSPFVGRGMWIWYVSQTNGGYLPSIIATAHTYGLTTLIVKAGDGTNAWSQFNAQLVQTLHASGVKVCAWQYVYGIHPIYEAQVGASAVRAGADCLVIDAESEYEGKYLQAQQYVQELRQLIGPNFPVALAGFPYVDYHPSFPYSVFLGAGGAQYNVPQMYWLDIGTTVENVYAHTYAFNALYQRPIEPLGELAGNPPRWQVLLFRQLSRPYGATLVSWWDWQGASAADWTAISEPFPNLQNFTVQTTFPTLSVSSAGGISAGDLVVWAQEHLLEAGEAIQIDGTFRSQTQLAVQAFQTAHGLPATGMIDQPTWEALLRYPRPSVVWTSATHATPARTAADRSRMRRRAHHFVLPVPSSARLPARGYEIPRDLGAGRRPR